MSYTRIIEAFFDIEYTETNICQIFDAGKATFTYCVFEDNWEGRSRGEQLSSQEATLKIINYQKDQTEQAYGPVVTVCYTRHNKQRVFTMGIHKTAAGKIEVTWNNLDPTEKTFASGEKGFDFSYFLSVFIDLYGHFELISLEATLL